MRTTTILVTTLLVAGCNQLFGGEVTGGDAAGGDDDDTGDASATSDSVTSGEDGGGRSPDARDGGATTDATSIDAPPGCTGWSARMVVTDGPARNSSLAVGPDGVVHVVHDRPDDSIAYLTRAPGAAWVAHPPIADAVRGDITVDATGKVHLVYEVESWLQLEYMSRTSAGNWTAPWSSNSDPGDSPEIVIGSSGPVVVGLYASTMRWGRPDPASWTISSANGTGTYFNGLPAFAIAGNGDLHVVARGFEQGTPAGTYRMWHATRSAQTGAWTMVNADSTWNDFGYDAAVAVDAAGTVHVVFTSAGGAAQGELRYVRRPLGGMFTTPLAPAPSRVVGDVAAAIDGAGTFHFVYQDTVEADLLYRRRTATGAWSNTETVDSVGGVGADADLVVGPSGTLHAIWYDEPGDRLLYASRCAP